MDIVLDARTTSRGEGEGQRRDHRGGLGQASDQILGNNNIGDGPFDLRFTRGPAAMRHAYTSTHADIKPVECAASGRLRARSICLSHRRYWPYPRGLLTSTSHPCRVFEDVLSYADFPISRASLSSRASDSPVSAASTPESPSKTSRFVTPPRVVWSGRSGRTPTSSPRSRS